MLVLFWATLLFSAQGASNADAGTVLGRGQSCFRNFCINVSEEAITAEAGLCAVIPCSVTFPNSFKLKGSVWCKIDPPKITCANSDTVFNSKDIKNVISGFEGRVALLKNNVTKNCSIIINDLTQSDSGSYIFRAIGTYKNKDSAYTFTTPTTITVRVLSQKPTLAFPQLTDGQQTTLTCTAPGRCSGSPPEITWTWRGTGENASHITSNTKNPNSVTQKHSSTLTFTPSAEHHGTEVTCKVSFTGNITTEQTVTLNVTYLKKPEITGNTTVREGDTLNLTCSAESYPPSLITWIKLYSHGTETELQNGTEKATLVTPNMRVEHSGTYVCTAQLLNTTRMVHANITMMFCPKILNDSECAVQSEVLICVCISQGAPLPTIKWPLLENNMDYSVIITVSSSTVNSTISLPVKDHSNTIVECVSSSEMGEVKRNLTIIKKKSQQKDEHNVFLSIALELKKTIVAFLIGALLSAIICCLTRRCHRTKQNSRDMAKTLEMVTSPDQQTNAGQAVKGNQTHKQEAPEGGNESGGQSSEAAGTSAPDGEPKDVDYVSINYSLLKNPQAAKKRQETTDTDYAEIKREEKEEGRGDGAQESEMCIVEEEEAMVGDDEKANHYMPEEGGEDVALYSNMKAIMGEE